MRIDSSEYSPSVTSKMWSKTEVLVDFMGYQCRNSYFYSSTDLYIRGRVNRMKLPNVGLLDSSSGFSSFCKSL